MKRIFFLTFLIFLFQNVQAEEQKLSEAYEHRVLERVKAIFSLEAPKEIEHPICATPIFVEINFNKPRFSAKTAQLLKPFISRPDFEGNTEYTFNTHSGHFKIHYTTTGTDEVFEPSKDDNPMDGVPDYVNRCADFFDSAWAKEVDGLGYNLPPSDSWYQPNGGDERYDIYLKNINQNYYGYTQPETSSSIRPTSYTSFIVVRNDYPICHGHQDKLDCLRATSAHEFFHAIQFGYDGSEFEFDDPNNESTYKPYWIEMSATWMEDMVFDDVNDYLNYLSSFFKHPEWSLKTFSYSQPINELVRDSAFHAYGGCIWPIFLSEKFDTLIIRNIWEECAKVPGPNVIDCPEGCPDGKSATDIILQTRGTTLEDVFREFTVWNYFTGDRRRPQLFYSEGELFPKVKVDSLHYHSNYEDSIYAPSGPNHPYNLGSNYVVFKVDPDLKPGGISIGFDGHDGDYKVSVVGYKSYPFLPFLSTLIGITEIYNWDAYDEVVMIPAVVTRNPNKFWTYEYHAVFDSSLHGEPTLPEEDKILPNYPNPFVLRDESDHTFFPFILSSPSRVRVDIFTLSGERIRTIIPKYDPKLVTEEYIHWLVLQELDMFWDGRNEEGEYVSSGIYLYRFRTDRATVIKKLAVIR